MDINEKEVRELVSMNKPPTCVCKVADGLCVAFNLKLEWKEFRKYVRKSPKNFAQAIHNFDYEKITEK